MKLFAARETVPSHLPTRLRPTLDEVLPSSGADGIQLSQGTLTGKVPLRGGGVKIRLADAGHAAAHFAGKFFVPANYPNSVSADYGITRKWQLARDLAGTVSAGYAVGMACSAATVPGLAAVGLTLFSYGLIRDRLNQVAGFLTSTCIPTSARNPRSWLLGGDIVDSAGVAIMSAAALIPKAFVPLSIGIGLVQVFAGTMRGAAGADISRRQAISDNLGELNAKNGNQGLIVNNLGLALGGALSAALGGTFGAATLPLIGAVAAGFGVYATSRLLANLDLHPVNESAVRKIVDSPGPVVGPDREKVWAALPKMWKSDKVQLGRDLELLERDPVRLAELKKLYSDKNYILEAVGGEPYIVVKPASSGEDRFQAVFQAVTMEKLKETPDYLGQLETQGQNRADFWLVQESLKKTPADVQPLLAEMKKSGWSIDLLRFLDTGVRSPG